MCHCSHTGAVPRAPGCRSCLSSVVAPARRPAPLAGGRGWSCNLVPQASPCRAAVPSDTSTLHTHTICPDTTCVAQSSSLCASAPTPPFAVSHTHHLPPHTILIIRLTALLSHECVRQRSRLSGALRLASCKLLLLASPCGAAHESLRHAAAPNDGRGAGRRRQRPSCTRRRPG